MFRSWRAALFILACGVFAGVTTLPAGALLIVAAVIFAAVVSPAIYPRPVTSAVASARSASDGKPVVYWRPGCPFCLRLRAVAGLRPGRAHWVNIWTDPEGAARVRSVADGNETVPTVFAGGSATVNPAPATFRALLGS